MDGKTFLDNYWQGIDTRIKKPVILTIEQLVIILDNYKKALDEVQP